MVNRRCPVDGLFLWLAVWVAKQYVNLIHASGIWTLCHSEITVLTDASIIMIIRCFLVTPKMTCEVDTEDTTYVKLFSDPRLAQTSFVEHPRALSNPIKNLLDRLEEIGLETLGSSRPIQDLLAELWECDASVFCMQLYDWLQKWLQELLIITKWLAIRGLDLDEYMTLLSSGGVLDGLELWAASLTMSTAFNIVIESTVWSTGINGIEEDNVWICLTSCETGQLCLLYKSPDEPDDLSSLGAATPSAAFGCKKGSWPLTVILEHVALLDSD